MQIVYLTRVWHPTCTETSYNSTTKNQTFWLANGQPRCPRVAEWVEWTRLTHTHVCTHKHYSATRGKKTLPSEGIRPMERARQRKRTTARYHLYVGSKKANLAAAERTAAGTGGCGWEGTDFWSEGGGVPRASRTAGWRQVNNPALDTWKLFRE